VGGRESRPHDDPYGDTVSSAKRYLEGQVHAAQEQQESSESSDQPSDAEDTDEAGDAPPPPEPDDGEEVSTPGTKYPNRKISQTTDEVRESLRKNGYTGTKVRDGVELWVKGDRTYVIRPSTSRGTKIDVSTGGEKQAELIPRNP